MKIPYTLLLATALIVGAAAYRLGVDRADQTAVPPYVYSTGWDVPRSEIREVNRSTGKEAAIFVASEAEGKEGIRYNIVAIPQIGYDGRIFVRRGKETPSGELYELELASRRMKKTELPYWPLGRLGATSPDQTHLAYVSEGGQAGADWKVTAYDFLTGETKTLGQANEGEYFAEFVGGDTFGNFAGGEVFWPDHHCFTVNVYEDPGAGEDPSHKKFKEDRKFCLP